MKIAALPATELIFQEHCARGCHNHPSAQNVSQAIQYSCNTYFFTVYKEVIDEAGYTLPEIGLRKLNSYLSEFGLGRKISVDLPSEKSGNLPGAPNILTGSTMENGGHHTYFLWPSGRENYN